MSVAPLNHPRSDWPALWRVLVVVIAIRAVVGGLMAACELYLPTPPHPDERMYVNIAPHLSLMGQLFVKWDSYWYLSIVEHGYRMPSAEQPLSSLAFAPLYPAAIRACAALGIQPWAAGVLVSLACYFLLLYYLYQLGLTLHSPRLGYLLMVFVSAFPSAWVLHMVYSEAMFCLVLAAFFTYYLRGQFGRAGWCAFVLPLVRIAGIALFPAILTDIGYRWWKHRRLGRELQTLYLAGLGLICLGSVYFLLAGNPLAFAAAGQTWFTPAGVEGHPLPLIGRFAMFLGKSPDIALSLLFMLLYGICTVLLLKKDQNICAWFALFYMVMLLKTPLVNAQMRYLLPLLPVHAYLLMRLMNDKLLTVVVVVLIVAQIVLTHLELDWRIII